MAQRKKTAAQLKASGRKPNVVKARQAEEKARATAQPAPTFATAELRDEHARLLKTIADAKADIKRQGRVLRAQTAGGPQRVKNPSLDILADAERALASLIRHHAGKKPGIVEVPTLATNMGASKEIEPSHVTLSDLQTRVQHERQTFASRIVADSTVTLDGELPFDWPLSHPATIARKYAMDCVQGEQVCGLLVKLAAARFLRDLEDGFKRGLFFDPMAAANVGTFFTDFVDWKVQPFQLFNVVQLFGWKRASGMRRFSFWFLSTARKNGKSALLSAVGVYILTCDGEPRNELYSAATTRSQARIIFKDAAHLARRSQFQESIIVQRNAISLDDDSVFTALASDADTLDGLRVGLGLVDEIHEHPNDGVWRKLLSGTGSRPQPIMCAATTAGENRNSWAYTMDNGLALSLSLVGQSTDEYFDKHLVYIARLSDDDDPLDENNWIKSNPNLGVAVNIEVLRTQAQEVKNDPCALLAWLRYHCNVWNSVVSGRSLPQDAIAACCGVDPAGRSPKELRHWFLENNTTTKYFAGFDASLSDDLAAFVLIASNITFPGGDTRKKTVYIPYFWTVSNRVLEHERLWRVPLQNWIREGHVEVGGEDLLDYDLLFKRICDICSQFKVREIGFDKWRSETLMARVLAARVSKTVVVPQLPSILTTPSKAFKDSVLRGEMAHLNNPVFTWMCSNVDLEPNEKTGGIKPSKAGGERIAKIDGVQAAITGLQRVLDPENTRIYSPKILAVRP